MKFLKNLFSKKRHDEPTESPYVDPMDPRGDGVLREGDPMFDEFMQLLNDPDRSTMTGTINPDGSIEIDE